MTKQDNRQPTIFIIFGASGDLTWRKLIPAIFSLTHDGWMPEAFSIIGVDRRQISNEEFRGHLREGSNQFARQPVTDAAQWATFADHISLLPGEFSDPITYSALAQAIDRQTKIWGKVANVIFYLAVPPTLIQTIVDGLGTAGLAANRSGHRIVVEKPFGRDLASAQALNRTIANVFEEAQIYRIDHYLGKETVQNILAFRFANAIFEPLWNRTWIDAIDITVAETVGVEQRGGYYDQAGALRDMIQNHLLQLLCLVAMEPPVAFAADEIRDKKVEVLRSIRPLTAETIAHSAVRGQYAGYRAEPNVARDSATETFVALTLHIDNWRWQDIPFTLRTGKRLQEKQSVITVHFRAVPHHSFPSTAVASWAPNVLRIHIQPDEGIDMGIQTKEPGPTFRLQPITMHFRYREEFVNEPLPEAYETLLLDVMQGEQTLFMRSDQVEAAWQVVMPLLTTWTGQADDLVLYTPGTWGPPL